MSSQTGQNSQKIYDVIVIGAGISGLSSAKYLHEKGADVLVLEARDRVGGRTFTVQNPNVKWVDLGGAYIGRTQNHILRLIDEFKLELYPVNEVEKLVHYGYNHKRSLFSRDELPAFSLLNWLDLNNVFRLMDSMGEEIPADAPWLAPNAQLWDQLTFKEFLEQNCRTQAAREFMRIFIDTIVTSEPHESSLLWFLWYVKQCGGTRPIFATTNGGQEFKVNGGTNQISDRIADKIGRQRVLLEQPVCYLEQSSNDPNNNTDNSVVMVRTLSGEEFRARYLIMATPPAIQQKIHYQPSLPPMRNQLIQRAPMGSVLKCMVYYKTSFWKENNMCGCLMIEGDDYNFPITLTLDDTKNDGSHPAIVGFLTANKARTLIELSKEERLKLICESYAKAFDSDEARHPIHYEEQNWMAEQYSGGCYTMTCQPGFLTRYGPYLRQPVGRIHYAGTETASSWSGYINGGVQSGERAAREVLHRMGRIPKPIEPVEEPVSKTVPPYIWPEPSFIEKYAPSANGLIHGLTGVTVLLSIGGVALWFTAKNNNTNVLSTLGALFGTKAATEFYSDKFFRPTF